MADQYIPPAHPRSGREPTTEKLEAEDEAARQLLADRDLPPSWLDLDDED